MSSRYRAALAIALFVSIPLSAASALTVSVPAELNAIVPSVAATTSTATSTASIASLQTLIAQLKAELSALVASHPANVVSTNATTSTSPVTFARVLSLGSTGADVSALQQILKSLGLYDFPTITGYFGALTEKAVAAFQTAQGFEPVGYTGPKTRGLLNSIVSASEANSTPQSATSAPRPLPTTPAGAATSSTANPLVPENSGGSAVSSSVEGDGGKGGGYSAPIESTSVGTSVPSLKPEQSGWTTYTNKQLGFSIQYPSQFSSVPELACSSGCNTREILILTDANGTGEFPNVSLEKQPVEYDGAIYHNVQDYMQSGDFAYDNALNPKGDIVSINGLNAIYYVFPPIVDIVDATSTMYIFIHNNLIFYVTLGADTQYNNKVLKSISFF